MSDPDTPIASQNGPYGVEVEAGKTYYWCACGRSKSQPFCDGSHKQTNLTPRAYTAQETGKKYFCGCRKSANAPLCDGTHNKG